MTEEEKIICKQFLNDADKTHSCNEYKLLMALLDQEPRKGEWQLTDVEGNKVWHCNCSECGKDPQDYVGGSENWWLIKSKLPKFCPNCGSDNREVVEE